MAPIMTTTDHLDPDELDLFLDVQEHDPAALDPRQAIALHQRATNAEATVRIKFKPAIVIGVGGTGCDVALIMQSHRERFLNEIGNSDVNRLWASCVHIFAIDTWAHPKMKLFGAGNGIVIPENPLGLNSRVRQLWRYHETFRRTWPSQNGVPYLPGDVFDGTGQDRLLARLAWILDQYQGGVTVANRVGHAVQQIQAALGPMAVAADGAFEIVIYIVRGTGGGTGSGLADAIAMELAARLPSSCRLIGVDLLPSAAELRVHPSEITSVRANAAAALAETERLMRGGNALAPFFERDGAQGTIRGGESPYLMTYLFGAENTNGLRLTRPGETEALAAHCLAAEIFLATTDSLADPNSQFRKQVTDLPLVDGRRWTYCSAAVSDLRFRPDLVAEYLAKQFAAALAGQRLSLRNVRETDAFQQGQHAGADYAATHRLSWTGGQLRVLLETALAGEPPLARQPMLHQDDQAWRDARRDGVAAVVRDRVAAFDDWRERQLRPKLMTRSEAVRAHHRGGDGRALAADGELFQAIDALLQSPDGWGYARAAGFIQALGALLATQYADLMKVLDGPEWRNEPGPGGLTERVARHRAAGPREARRLQEGFGPLDRRGGNAKRAFEQQWWQLFVRHERDLVVAGIGRQVIADLLADLKTLGGWLKQVDSELVATTRDSVLTAPTALADRTRGGILETRVLAEPELIETAFQETAARAMTDHAADAAIAATATGDQSLRSVLHRALVDPDAATTIAGGVRGVVAHLIATGIGLFQNDVAKLSFWEALQTDLHVRLQRQHLNPPLTQALQEEAQLADAQQGIATDTERAVALLRRYAEKLLAMSLNRAAPFWPLDKDAPIISRPPAGRPRPFPLHLIAYDERVYDAFLHQANLPDFLPQVVKALGVETSTRPGRHTVTVYNRAGGIPLFYLSREMTTPLVNAAAVVEQARPLFTDVRFSPVIDEFAPPETGDARRRYTIAAAIRLGIGRVRDDGAVSVQLNGHGRVEIPSVLDAALALADDEALAGELAAAVDASYAALPELRRRELLGEITGVARGQAARARSRGETAVDRWWEDTAVAVEERMNDGRYRLA